HGQSDSIERITHSICTLEFENHRPLYDWYIQQLGIYAPQQIEFARLNLTYTVLSKRRLIQLVREGHVRGWDDPRMPTISGLRRRGYTPEAIRNFCERIGVSKFNGVIDMSWLEGALREDLNKRAPRVLAVLRPLKVVIENYPDDRTEELDAVNNPEDASARHAVPVEARLYDHLFSKPNPEDVAEGQDYKGHLNANSLEVVQGFVEPSAQGAASGTKLQFERLGYFCVDSKDSTPEKLVFN